MTAIFYDDIFLEHDTGQHPECSLRLINTVERLKKNGLWEKCNIHSPRAAKEEELRWTHTASLIKAIKDIASRGGGYFDLDTPISPRSYEAALKAAGAAMDATELVLSGKEKNALCLVRPPGHHATPNRAMGFCLFNNIALAAAYAINIYGLSRVFIIDFDVHHGNGTQEIFYEEPRVLYSSLHRFPFYPGTGSQSEKGYGEGAHFNENVPLEFDTSEEQYLAALDALLEGPAAKFDPELVLISAGFDAFEGDPIAGLGLSINAFGIITKKIRDFADKHCGGKIVSALEGGYHLNALPLCIEAHLKALM